VRQILPELQDVLRRVFDDNELVVDEHTSAAEVDGWDSMAHIRLVLALEKRFAVKFTGSELAALGRHGQNVGVMLQLIEAKTGAHAASGSSEGSAG
jgi:acyl carrier protein